MYSWRLSGEMFFVSLLLLMKACNDDKPLFLPGKGSISEQA